MDSNQAGSSGVKLITRRTLFDMMQEQNSSFEDKLKHKENYLISIYDYSEEEKQTQMLKIKKLKVDFRQKWITASRNADRFRIQNQNWLQGAIEIPRPSKRAGRPLKSFEESSDRSKRRKTEDLRSTVSPDELSFATHVSLYVSGQRDASKVLKDITTSPKRATKYKQAFYRKPDAEAHKMSPLQALVMFVDADLSRNQYEIIRNANKALYPCYSLIQKAKRECYPKKEEITVTDTDAEISLQSNLDLTINRLFLYLKDVVESLTEHERNALVLICKWGCDGSHQFQYKQRFENEDGSDAFVFQSSFVPLRIICESNSKIIWQNPTPSSPRYCRPIHIRFIKETTKVINEEISYVRNAINSLKPTKATVDDKQFSVKHTMMLTMVDGKVCNAATETTSTMKCYVCSATSKDFNKLNTEKQVNTDTLEFGISVLHARIRIFENILHLSYKFPLKKWRLTDEKDKKVFNDRKALIQEQFRKKMGLIVDVPKPGFGNSNDGNTSRRFFADPELAAEITGVDLNLIFRLKVTLEILASGFKIDTEKLEKYNRETALLYVKLYEWYPMTPTLHKILIHSSIIAEHVLLPLGQLSEEAVEARNKHMRLYRQNFSRKFSRQACNTDVLNRLLLSSDPLITGLRKIPRKKSEPLLNETLQMLLLEEDVWLGHATDEFGSSEEDVLSESD